MPKNKNILTAEELLDSVSKQIENFGVSDFVIYLRNPDRPCELFKIKGSRLWALGVAQELTKISNECRNVSYDETEDICDGEGKDI